MARKIDEFVIIGFGSMGKKHAENLMDLGIKGIAVADPLSRYAEDYKDSDECLEREAEGRLVVIASPTHLHAEHAITALHCGAAAIYVEKPLTVNTPDAYDILDLAQEYQVPVVVGYNFRAHPGVAFLLKNIVQPNFYFGAHGIDDISTWPTSEKFGPDSYLHAETGGILWTSCSHAVDLAIAIHGTIINVGAIKMPEEKTIVIRAVHANGGLSTLYNKWEDDHPPMSMLTYSSNPDAIVVDLLAKKIKSNTHKTLMSNFIAMVEGRTPGITLPSLEEAIHGVEVLVAVEESIATSREVIL